MQTQSQSLFDVDAMCNVLRRILQILKHESSAVSKMRVSALSENQVEKYELTHFLEMCKQTLAQNPQIMRQIPEQKKKVLKSLYIEFEGELENHHRQLIKVRKVHSLLMNMVQKTMRKKLSSGSGYTNTGNINQAPLNEAFIPPFSLSQHF